MVEIMDAVHRDEIKGMYIMGENPAMSDPDVQHARGARPSRTSRRAGHLSDRNREDQPGNEIVFGDCFPTPSVCAKLVPAAIIPPAEEPDQEYPMVLTGLPSKYRSV
jgi:predicted molibdopterin-dependent oxidoreductase YjgC